MAERAIIKPLEQITVALGQTKQRQLPKTTLRAIKCKLETAVTNGASGVANSALATMKLINSLKVNIKGSKDIMQVDGEYLYYLNFLAKQGIIAQSITNTATETHTNYVNFDLPHTLPHSANAEDALLLSKLLKSPPILDVLFNSSIGANVTVNSGTIYLYPDEYAYNDDAKEAVNPSGLFCVSKQKEDFTSTGSDKLIKLPVGPKYKRILLVTKDASAVEQNNIISNVKIEARGTEFLNIPATFLRDMNAEDSGIAQASFPTGLYVYDFTRMGRLGQALASGALSELNINLTIANAGNVTVYAEKFDDQPVYEVA
jgi:hypothetical protein